MTPVWLTDTVTNDLDRALHYSLLWGLEGVELRTVGGASDQVPFVNEEKLRRRLTEHDMPVAAVVPGLFGGLASERAAWLNEIALMEETLAFCHRFGCSRVVVSAFSEAGADDTGHVAEALRRAGEAAARRGVTLTVLNEVDMAHATGTALAGLLTAVAHPSVQAAWDPAAAAQAGEDPQAGLQALAGHVGFVRCCNVAAQGAGWRPASLHEGIVDWPAQLQTLHDAGYDGPVSLAVHLTPKPKHGLRMATALIKMMRAVR